jgi:hypothetical protein
MKIRPGPGVLLLGALLAASCRSAEVVNYCVEHPDECAPCASDSDCKYAGNPCTATVYCAQTDTAITVVSLGCDGPSEYAWPDPSTCQCEAAVCRSELGRETGP